MALPRALARFNRVVTNRIQGRWAYVAPGYGVLEHTGRRSGRMFRTPLNVWPAESGFAILVVYGLRSDWVRNVQALGGATLVHRRNRYTLSNPQIVSGAAARTLLPLPGRVMSRLTRSADVLLLSAVPA